MSRNVKIVWLPEERPKLSSILRTIIFDIYSKHQNKISETKSSNVMFSLPPSFIAVIGLKPIKDYLKPKIDFLA